NAYQTVSELYGRDLRDLLDGPQVTADQRESARALVADAGEVLDRALSDVDVVMCATVPIIAPHIGLMEIGLGDIRWPIEFLLTRLTSIANAMGVPPFRFPRRLNRRCRLVPSLLPGETVYPNLWPRPAP